MEYGFHDAVSGYDPDQYATPQSAAVGVGVMLASVTALLILMKKSGFRAMVAVGNG